MTTLLSYSEFVEMFEPTQDFSGYEDVGDIRIMCMSIKCKNPARESSGEWCAFLWKPSSEVYNGKWIREEFRGSSPFAIWWCQQDQEFASDNED